jgi:acetyltransferase-like isoleucine patch superfamily enzyme
MPSLSISTFVPCLNKSTDPRYANCDFGDYTYGHPKIQDFGEGIRLKIGKFCSIADDSVFMLGGEHRLDMVTTYPFSNFFEFAWSFQGTHPRVKGNITVGNDVWIGQEAFILSGVTIGNGAVVAARAVVTRDVAPYSIVAGSPARHLKFRVPEDLIGSLNIIAWWDWPIEQIAEAMPFILSNPRAFVEKYLEIE